MFSRDRFRYVSRTRKDRTHKIIGLLLGRLQAVIITLVWFTEKVPLNQILKFQDHSKMLELQSSIYCSMKIEQFCGVQKFRNVTYVQRRQNCQAQCFCEFYFITKPHENYARIGIFSR